MAPPLLHMLIWKGPVGKYATNSKCLAFVQEMSPKVAMGNYINRGEARNDVILDGFD